MNQKKEEHSSLPNGFSFFGHHSQCTHQYINLIPLEWRLDFVMCDILFYLFHTCSMIVCDNSSSGRTLTFRSAWWCANEQSMLLLSFYSFSSNLHSRWRAVQSTHILFVHTLHCFWLVSMELLRDETKVGASVVQLRPAKCVRIRWDGSVGSVQIVNKVSQIYPAELIDSSPAIANILEFHIHIYEFVLNEKDINRK